ncbi:GNAT family N-acetyltransferase [Micromonospora pattaloongensis]|uniref:GNAT family N-acetyltransferase n=1 Tax=Micromonospora pattaloongensis TaxID=405436 RepID=UPI000B894744|nr:GNAT family N-acetyltransferase [Micromonospora pattaloongensis]
MRRDDGYELSTDPTRIDVDRVHHWLSTDAYWAIGRPRDVLARAIAGSTAFGVYRPTDGAQVAFARAVTDGATFAWLCDVYVDRAERGHGLGAWMVGSVRDELATRGVRRILLATLDAHGVYAGLGFTALSDPVRWMEYDRRGVNPVTGNDREPSAPLTVTE